MPAKVVPVHLMVSPVWCVWWAEIVSIHHYKELGVTCVVRVVG